MPQFRSLSQLPQSFIEVDLVIVGTGPAGATLARELSGTGLRILLVESGGVDRQSESDELDEVESIGYPRVADQWLVRNRILGGSSHTWSGRCVPFDEIDYAPRAWVRHSGWPMGAQIVNPYLDRAAPYLGLSVGTGFTDDRFWALAGRKNPLPKFDEQRLMPHIWQFSRDKVRKHKHTRFGPTLASQLGDNVTLVTNATLCDIYLNDLCNQVTAVSLAGPEGTRRRISVNRLVLCCGGIENARLLLNADSQVVGGIGNGRDQVGRYLMDHLRGPVGQFQQQDVWDFRRMFGHYRIKGGQVFAAGLRLSPALQAKEGLLNCSAWLEGQTAKDDPWNALKELARGQVKAKALGNVLGNLRLLARGARDHLILRNGLARKIDQLNVVCMVEQIPDPESRVILSDMRDRFGLRRAKLDWRVHDQEILTMVRMAELLGAAFAELKLPPVVTADWVKTGGPLPSSFRDVAHPTGTTRMGLSPTDSVVDTHCQVHGVQGMYVAGSSVFPTSSHANPTQMIVALVLRLADRLRP